MRLLLEERDDSPDLAAVLGIHRQAVRRLARGWPIPLGPTARDRLRGRVLDRICPLCQAAEAADQEREIVLPSARPAQSLFRPGLFGG